MDADTLGVSGATIGGTISAANGIYSLGKAIITSSVVIGGGIWVFKKFSAYLTEHHSNVTKHTTGREEALDKKEDLLFNTTTQERKDNFELLKAMLAESANQTVAIKANADNSAKMIDIIQSHSNLLQENTNFISKLADAIRLGNMDVVNKIHNIAEDSFSKYVDLLQRNPEIAKRILGHKQNPITTVMNQVAETIEHETVVEPQDSPATPPLAA